MKEKLLKLVTSDGFSQQTPSFLVYIKKFLNPGIWRALFKEYILDNIEPALISFIDEYEQTESPSTTTPIRFCAKTPVTHLKKSVQVEFGLLANASIELSSKELKQQNSTRQEPINQTQICSLTFTTTSNVNPTKITETINTFITVTYYH